MNGEGVDVEDGSTASTDVMVVVIGLSTGAAISFLVLVYLVSRDYFCINKEDRIDKRETLTNKKERETKVSQTDVKDRTTVEPHPGPHPGPGPPQPPRKLRRGLRPLKTLSRGISFKSKSKKETLGTGNKSMIVDVTAKVGDEEWSTNRTNDVAVLSSYCSSPSGKSLPVESEAELKTGSSSAARTAISHETNQVLSARRLPAKNRSSRVSASKSHTAANCDTEDVDFMLSRFSSISDGMTSSTGTTRPASTQSSFETGTYNPRTKTTTKPTKPQSMIISSVSNNGTSHQNADNNKFEEPVIFARPPPKRGMRSTKSFEGYENFLQPSKSMSTAAVAVAAPPLHVERGRRMQLSRGGLDNDTAATAAAVTVSVTTTTMNEMRETSAATNEYEHTNRSSTINSNKEINNKKKQNQHHQARFKSIDSSGQVSYS
jgi:hypothetical protein